MWFTAETLARLRRLAADAAVTVRADAGFFSYGMIDAIEAKSASWSIAAAQNAKAKAAVDAIDDNDWAPIAYTRGGVAQVAETTITTGRRDPKGPRTLWLIARRTRLKGPQAELWPDWRRHCLVTNRDDLDTAAADTYHRAHARAELAIRDLKDNGHTHCPSGKSTANAAWLACAALTTSPAGAPAPDTPNTHNSSPPQPQSATGSSPRPGRLVNHSGQHILRLPANRPWANTRNRALQQLPNLPLLT